jgi:aspartate kinase
VFSTISDINVTLISQGASSINLTFAIEEEHVNEAVTRLHEAFFGQANVNTRSAK